VPCPPRIHVTVFLSALLLAAALAASSAQSATVKRCKAVLNPYPGTRFDDVDLTRIRAAGVSCRAARRVARGAPPQSALTDADAEWDPEVHLAGLGRGRRPSR
jgi:hypothetical protein